MDKNIGVPKLPVSLINYACFIINVVAEKQAKQATQLERGKVTPTSDLDALLLRRNSTLLLQLTDRIKDSVGRTETDTSNAYAEIQSSRNGTERHG